MTLSDGAGKDMAEAIGLIPLEHLDMEMLVPRDIFKANAIPTEMILRFEKPAS